MPKTDPKFNIPAGRRPEEFLGDADLVIFHEQRLADMDKDDPGYKDQHAAVVRARRAAALTAAAVPPEE